MRIIETKIFNFNELSPEAKETAIEKYYENEEYHFLGDDLLESCKEYLREKECTYYDIKVFYSLCNCQGDGLVFEGEVYNKEGETMRLKHTGRYYHSKSVNMEFFNTEGNEVDEIQSLKNIYFEICNKLEEEGYSIIEYRMKEDEFNDLSEANQWEYTETGKRI